MAMGKKSREEWEDGGEKTPTEALAVNSRELDADEASPGPCDTAARGRKPLTHD